MTTTATERSTLLRQVGESHRVRLLHEDDVKRVEAIVNWSYRGILPSDDDVVAAHEQQVGEEDKAKGGQWTTESHLLAGPRITQDGLRRLLKLDPFTRAAVFVLEERSGEAWQVVGSVLVEKEGDEAHLGMFNIHPHRQGRGLGRKLMVVGEEHGTSPEGMGCSKVVLHVLGQREDLLAFYQRHGYRLLPLDAHPFLTLPDEIGQSLLPPDQGQLHFRILVKHTGTTHNA